MDKETIELIKMIGNDEPQINHYDESVQEYMEKDRTYHQRSEKKSGVFNNIFSNEIIFNNNIETSYDDSNEELEEIDITGLIPDDV